MRKEVTDPVTTTTSRRRVAFLAFCHPCQPQHASVVVGVVPWFGTRRHVPLLLTSSRSVSGDVVTSCVHWTRHSHLSAAVCISCFYQCCCCFNQSCHPEFLPTSSPPVSADVVTPFLLTSSPPFYRRLHCLFLLTSLLTAPAKVVR